jgi:hypothetical protein
MVLLIVVFLDYRATAWSHDVETAAARSGWVDRAVNPVSRGMCTLKTTQCQLFVSF